VRVVLEPMESTYDAGSTLAAWDRKGLTYPLGGMP